MRRRSGCYVHPDEVLLQTDLLVTISGSLSESPMTVSLTRNRIVLTMQRESVVSKGRVHLLSLIPDRKKLQPISISVLKNAFFLKKNHFETLGKIISSELIARIL